MEQRALAHKKRDCQDHREAPAKEGRLQSVVWIFFDGGVGPAMKTERSKYKVGAGWLMQVTEVLEETVTPQWATAVIFLHSIAS